MVLANTSPARLVPSGWFHKRIAESIQIKRWSYRSDLNFPRTIKIRRVRLR